MSVGRMKLEGGKEVERALAKLDLSLRKKVLRRAVGQAAKPMLRSAKSKIDSDTGLLRESMGIRIKMYTKTGTAVAIIGPRTKVKAKKIRERLGGKAAERSPSRMAHFVEFGTKPHMQKGFPVAGGFVTFGGDRHPGVKKKPFLRPAFDEHVHGAARSMGKEVWKGIEWFARKAAKKR